MGKPVVGEELLDRLIDQLRKKGLSYREIFSMLDSSEAAVSLIPIEIFEDRRLGPLEAIILYLKDQRGLTYHKIALLLKRNDRTIWTAYQKARRKVQ